MDLLALKIELEREPDSLSSTVIREIFRGALERIAELEKRINGFEGINDLYLAEYKRAEAAEAQLAALVEAARHVVSMEPDRVWREGERLTPRQLAMDALRKTLSNLPAAGNELLEKLRHKQETIDKLLNFGKGEGARYIELKVERDTLAKQVEGLKKGIVSIVKQARAELSAATNDKPPPYSKDVVFDPVGLRQGFFHFARHSKRTILLSETEVQSGLDRVKWAEGLIQQLPESHDGRNSWLLNYGQSKQPPPLAAAPEANPCPGCKQILPHKVYWELEKSAPHGAVHMFKDWSIHPCPGPTVLEQEAGKENECPGSRLTVPDNDAHNAVCPFCGELKGLWGYGWKDGTGKIEDHFAKEPTP